jgi:hypothetical protein
VWYGSVAVIKAAMLMPASGTIITAQKDVFIIITMQENVPVSKSQKLT